MPNYICNKNADEKGRHEVHTTSCPYLPLPDNCISIGWKSNCLEAIQQMYEWNSTGYRFDGCFWCCNPCHKGQYLSTFKAALLCTVSISMQSLELREGPLYKYCISEKLSVGTWTAIYAVVWVGQTDIKKVYREGNCLRLVSHNAKYSDKYAPFAEGPRIIGKTVDNFTPVEN